MMLGKIKLNPIYNLNAGMQHIGHTAAVTLWGAFSLTNKSGVFILGSQLFLGFPTQDLDL